ncbi:hypothetical protein PsYK624_014630 [Phanerochaete sordida]|uniref:F-box domain-containing protein n=1 Tax=Phanerochaete sordida TaxID=48140 RepID=A0A9P3G0B2_9APHY|nr:hypothetical protein PsYK624_014630 [Phanerochaete sordida]
MIRTLKTIALVCKEWHAAAHGLLYRDVVLRRVGQATALARTLRSSPEVFSRHVSSIAITCAIPNAWLRTTLDSVAYIVKQCPNLSSLTFQEEYISPVESHEWSASHAIFASPVPSKISHLGLADGQHFSNPKPPFPYLEPFLNQCSHLSSLSIAANSLPFDFDRSVLSFPQLETLTVWTSQSADNKDGQLPPSWDLPKLRALHFRPGLICTRAFGATLIVFCKNHAETITNLDFGGGKHFSFDPTSIEQQAAAACLLPNLAHLVLQVSPSPGWTHEGMWNYMAGLPLWKKPVPLVEVVIVLLCSEDPHHLLGFVREAKWKRIRYLDQQLLTWIPEATYIFPARSDTEVVEMNCYGLQIWDTKNELVFNADLWGDNASQVELLKASDDDKAAKEGGDDEDANNDGGSEYQPSDSDEESDDLSTEASESDGEPEPLSENEALTIYADTLEE